MRNEEQQIREFARAPLALAVANSPEEWQVKFGAVDGRSSVTIGNFDGVHLGHQKILSSVKEWVELKANLCKGADRLVAAVLTFYPHPARVLRPNTAPALLLTLPQRLAAFETAGMIAALVLKFDAELAKVSAEDFVERYLVETMRAKAIFVGGNFRFGHRQAGDVKLLEKLGRRWDFEVHVVPPVVAEGIVVSSSAIREAVREGRMEDAARLLGRPFALEGEIRPGTGVGGKLVVPTLNLATEQECLPKMGVYATETIVDGKLYGSATNVGMRPTFDGTRLAIESHLLDFAQQLTDGPMEVRFCTRLRDEQKFAGPQTLREQVLKDIEQAREFFRSKSNRK
jgi:riboflavin kinase / FMN adenylyltransferase